MANHAVDSTPVLQEGAIMLIVEMRVIIPTVRVRQRIGIGQVLVAHEGDNPFSSTEQQFRVGDHRVRFWHFSPTNPRNYPELHPLVVLKRVVYSL